MNNEQSRWSRATPVEWDESSKEPENPKPGGYLEILVNAPCGSRNPLSGHCKSMEKEKRRALEELESIIRSGRLDVVANVPKHGVLFVIGRIQNTVARSPTIGR